MGVPLPYTAQNNPYTAFGQELTTGMGLRSQARQTKLGEQQDEWNRGRLERGEQRDIEQTEYTRNRQSQSDQQAILQTWQEWHSHAPQQMAMGSEAYQGFLQTGEQFRSQAAKLGMTLPPLPQYDPRYFEQSEQQRALGSLKDTSSLIGQQLNLGSPQGRAAGRAAGLAMPQPQAPPQLPAGPPLAQGQPPQFNMLNQAFPGMQQQQPQLPAAPPAEAPMWETPGKEMSSRRTAQFNAAKIVLSNTEPNSQERMAGLGAAAPDFPEIQAGLLGVARMTGAQEAGAQLGQEKFAQTVTYQGGILEHYKAMEGIARGNTEVARIRANAYADAQKLSGQTRGKLTANEYARIITSCASDVQNLGAAKIKGKGKDSLGATIPWSAQESQQIDQLIADREANRDLALQGQQATGGGVDLKKTVPEWQAWIKTKRAQGAKDGQLQQYMVDHLWSAAGAAGLLGRTR